MAKIMLVEDDNNLREIYQARLAAEGYETVTAADGEEALAMAVKEKPDLIIADIMMPKISGFDMLDIMRSTPEIKNTKIIMMTALSQAEDKERASKLGADRYLVKSQVTLEDVVKTAKEVLEGKEDSSDMQLPAAPKPAATAPTTSSMPVTPEPGTSAPAAPVPDNSSTSIPVSVATPSDPTPTPTTSTEPLAPASTTKPPADASITIDDAGNLSQSESSEAASVSAQIDNFIKQTGGPTTASDPSSADSGSTSPKTDAKPADAPDAPVIPVSDVATPAASTPPSAPDAPSTAPTTPPTSVATHAATPIATSVPVIDTSLQTQLQASVEPRHSTKIIPPLHDLSKQPDFAELVAKADSQSAASTPPTADTVIAPGGSTTLASIEPTPSEKEDTEPAEVAPTESPLPTTPHPPGHVFLPTSPAPDVPSEDVPSSAASNPNADPDGVAI